MLARERRAMLRRHAQRGEIATLTDRLESVEYDVSNVDSEFQAANVDLRDLENDVRSLESRVDDVEGQL